MYNYQDMQLVNSYARLLFANSINIHEMTSAQSWVYDVEHWRLDHHLQRYEKVTLKKAKELFIYHFGQEKYQALLNGYTEDDLSPNRVLH